MDLEEKVKITKEIHKSIKKAKELYNEKKWEKASDLFKEIGLLAKKINDEKIYDECLRYISICMIKIKEAVDKQKKGIENSFSDLYD